MEIDSSAIESNNLVEFPKFPTNSTITLNSNSLCYNNDFTNNLNGSYFNNINKTKNEIKKPKLNKKKESKEKKILSIAKKISKNKMNYMNIYKIYETINNYKNNKINDPINKYVNDFKPYIYKKIKKEDLSSNFMELNRDFLYDIEKINFKTKKSKKGNEKLLNFKNDKSKLHNYYLSRTDNTEKRKKEKTYEENIIILQKNIKGFLYRIKLNKEISRLTLIYIIEKIIKIQNAVRVFLKKEKRRKKIIIKIIKKERKLKANKIIDLFLMYHWRNQYKKYLIIQKILYQRIKSANKIKKAFKNFLFRQKINRILYLKRNNLEIIYPINKKKDIQLKIYYNDGLSELFKFEFCEIRKIYVLYLNEDILDNNYNNQNGYLCHFFIDNQCVIDKRYKIIKNKSGVIYNFIEFPQKDKIINNNKIVIKKDNYKNKLISKFDKLEMKTIPFINKNLFIYKTKNNNNIHNNLITDKNNNNSLTEINENDEIFKNEIFNEPKGINGIDNEEIKEKRKKRKYNNSISEKNLNNESNSNNNKIIIYGENFISDYNTMKNNNSLNNNNYRNNLQYNPYYKTNLNDDINDYLFENSSSTISNSNTYNKLNNNLKTENNMIKVKSNQVNNKLNNNNNNNKKKKKTFPIFY